MSEEFESDAETPAEDPSASMSPPSGDPIDSTSSSEAGGPDEVGGDFESTALAGPSLASVIDVPLRVNVEIGAAKMLVREVLQLNKGSVVPLDRMSGDPADILVNGRLIARGEVTVLEDSLAVRIVELVGREQATSAR